MSIEQAFVSTVAFVLAAVCLGAALFDVQWFFRMPKAQWAEARWGHRGARLAFGLIGLVLVLLGLYIALGNQGGTSRTEGVGSGTGFHRLAACATGTPRTEGFDGGHNP
jgi:hypothetical protein